jgi:hypothetical protein
VLQRPHQHPVTGLVPGAGAPFRRRKLRVNERDPHGRDLVWSPNGSMRLLLTSILVIAAVATEFAFAQQRNPWDDLLAPRQTLPQQRQQPAPQQQPQTQPPPGGIQSAPLPPPDTAAPQQPQQQQPAQKGRPATKQQQQPAEVPVERPPDQKIANPTAVFSGLDKITGRIFPFEVAIDETVQFGALQVTPRACYTRPPTEPQNTTGFIQVDEITLDGKMRRIFNGWMFAASPGLHAVEHAIYDVWLVDCKQGPPDLGRASG